MSQTVCQTASVDQTGELSQAVGHNTTIGNEANAGTDAARQLVLWELGRQQVTVDFSAGNIVTDTHRPRYPHAVQQKANPPRPQPAALAQTLCAMRAKSWDHRPTMSASLSPQIVIGAETSTCCDWLCGHPVIGRVLSAD